MKEVICLKVLFHLSDCRILRDKWCGNLVTQLMGDHLPDYHGIDPGTDSISPHLRNARHRRAMAVKTEDTALFTAYEKNRNIQETEYALSSQVVNQKQCSISFI